MLIPGISIIHSSVKKWWSVTITTFNLPKRRGHAGREAIPLAYRGGTPALRPEYPWKLMRVFPSSTMFPLYMYVCMQSTWCMNVVQYWRKKRRESRAGSDVISVTRLRDWRIERTNWKPTRYVSPPVARVVKQSLLRRSIRTRTRLGSSRFRCLPALSSFLLSFFPLLLWVSTRGKWRREGGAGERLSRRRLSPPRSLFYFSREICRVGRKRRRNLPSRPFGWVATFRKRREKIRVFIIFIIGEHKHLRHSTQWREKGRIVEQDDRLQDEGRKNKKTFRGKEEEIWISFLSSRWISSRYSFLSSWSDGEGSLQWLTYLVVADVLSYFSRLDINIGDKLPRDVETRFCPRGRLLGGNIQE